MNVKILILALAAVICQVNARPQYDELAAEHARQYLAGAGGLRPSGFGGIRPQNFGFFRPPFASRPQFANPGGRPSLFNTIFNPMAWLNYALQLRPQYEQPEQQWVNPSGNPLVSLPIPETEQFPPNSEVEIPAGVPDTFFQGSESDEDQENGIFDDEYKSPESTEVSVSEDVANANEDADEAQDEESESQETPLVGESEQPQDEGVQFSWEEEEEEEDLDDLQEEHDWIGNHVQEEEEGAHENQILKESQEETEEPEPEEVPLAGDQSLDQVEEEHHVQEPEEVHDVQEPEEVHYVQEPEEVPLAGDQSLDQVEEQHQVQEPEEVPLAGDQSLDQVEEQHQVQEPEEVPLAGDQSLDQVEEEHEVQEPEEVHDVQEPEEVHYVQEPEEVHHVQEPEVPLAAILPYELPESLPHPEDDRVGEEESGKQDHVPEELQENGNEEVPEVLEEPEVPVDVVQPIILPQDQLPQHIGQAPAV